MTGGTQLLQNKMSVNFGATLDPYALDNNNTKIDKFNIDSGGSLFRVTSANIAMSYSFSSKDFEGGEDRTNDRAREESQRSGGRDDDLFGRPMDFSDKSLSDGSKDDDQDKEKTSKLYSYKIPWNIRLAYALNYSNTHEFSLSTTPEYKKIMTLFRPTYSTGF